MSDANPSTPSPEYLAALSAAIERDHPAECGSGYCDISAALRAGFPMSAAHLLSGATECPNLDRFRAERGGWPMRDGWPIDWPEWVEWFRANSRECNGCGSFTFTDEGEPDSCANCGGELEPPAPPPPALRDALRAAERAAEGLRILSGDEVGDGSAWQEEARRVAVHLRTLAGWFDEVAGGAPGADEVSKVAALAAGLDE